MKIPLDQLVQKGGYNDVKEAVEDIIRRHKRFAAEKAKVKPKKVRHEQEREKQPDVGDEDRRKPWASVCQAREYLGFSQDQVATILGVRGRRCRRWRPGSARWRCWS